MFQERDVELLLHRERFVRHTKHAAKRRADLEARLEHELREAEAKLQAHLAKMEGLRVELGNNKNNYTPTLLRLQREAEAANKAFAAAINERFEALRGSAAGLLRSVQQMNADFENSWKPFEAGGNFNEVEKGRFRERLSKVDEAAAAAAAAQETRLLGLAEAQREQAAAALVSFGETLALNLEDIRFMEGLKLRQGKASAEMRIELTRSVQQASAIDERLGELRKLLPARGGGGGGGAAAAAAAAARPSTADGEGGEGEGEGEEEEEEAEAKDPMGGALARALLGCVDMMRIQLLERANFLEVLKSTAIPTGAIDTTIPLALGEEGEGARAASAGRRPELVALMPSIAAIREKHEAELLSFCEAYYADKGEREITRPGHIPPTVAEHKAKLGKVLDGFVAKAHKERADAVLGLRLQLIGIARACNLVAPAAFEDLANGAKGAARRAAEAREASTRSLFADLQRKRELHQAALKPSLRNPSSQAELLALEQAEASRSDTALQTASRQRAELLQSETQHAAALMTRLLRGTEALLALFDATLMADDLVPADEPPEDIHHGLKKKMRIDAREAAADANNDPIPDGRPFPRHVWSGLPLAQLQPAAAGVVEQEAAAPAPADEEAAGLSKSSSKAALSKSSSKAELSKSASAAELPATSAELTSNFTRAHRSVIAARDRTYAAYRVYYGQHVHELARACDAMLASERQWALNWSNMVSQLKAESV